jgi:hypothetical protein
MPTFEGPQLQSPPQGFLMVEGSHPIRQMVSGLTPVFRAAWIESSVDASSIFIDGYPAVLGYEDAVAARDSARRYVIDRDTSFGEVEPISVDGRSGWGWHERVETPARGLVWVAYRALVPYDSVTYAIEFASGNPTFKRGAPDTLKAVIATFGIGRTTYDVPLIALIAGLTLFALALWRSKAEARAKRLRSIPLAKVPKKQPPAEPAAAPTRPKASPPIVPSSRPFPDWRKPKAPPPGA